MIYAQVGEETTLSWVYEQELPQPGTVFATIHNSQGTPVPGLVNVPLPEGQTYLTLTPEQVILNPAQSFESYQLRLRFQTSQGPRTLKVSYVVVNLPSLLVTEKDVRSFIGIQTDELPDADIDMVQAFYTAAEMITEAQLRIHLSAGDVRALRANELIKLLAVLEVGPSLMQRIAQTMQDSNLKFQRNSVDSFETLLTQARARIVALQEELQPVTSTGATFTLFTLAPSATDAITGA